MDVSTGSNFLALEEQRYLVVPIGDCIALPTKLARGSVIHPVFAPFLVPRA